MFLRQIALVPLTGFPRRHIHAQFAKQYLKTANQYLVPGQDALFQQLPLGGVDDMVAVQDRPGGFHVPLPQCPAQRMDLSPGKIQKRIIQVQKNRF